MSRSLGPIFVVVSLVGSGCAAPPRPTEPAAGVAPMPANQIFESYETEAGVDFVHFNGMAGEMYMAEVMGSGAAWLDYDNDGDLDLYLVQGSMIGPGKTLEDALHPPPAGSRAGDRLYRNDLDDAGALRFTDVTAASGIAATGYGMGVAAGDYDNDGHVDLYVTNLGPNQLWRNDGDGTFRDVTSSAGVAGDRWSTSASFLDHDGDGLLDLYVTNYVDFSPQNHKACSQVSSAPDYCGPKTYRPQPDRLYRNRGDGSFEDATERAGMRTYGAGLGVVAADFNGDGLTDLYVANDADENQLWINRGGGRFADRAFIAGAAVNTRGEREAGMGVDAADFDDDGDEDLFVTHLDTETHTLYVNDGRGGFRDRTRLARLAAPSLRSTGFGTAWLDYDNDGGLDLFVANGAVRIDPGLAAAGDPYPLHEPNQLFRSLRDGTFEEITARAGAAFALSEVGRGAAFGDADNDGDTDILLTNNNGPARLLLNRVGQDAHWLGLRLVGEDGRRDLPGTRAALIRPGSSATLWRRVRTDGSYLSANDPRVLFGLGDDPRVERVRVRWPDGSVEAWEAPAVDSYHTLVKGEGREVAADDAS